MKRGKFTIGLLFGVMIGLLIWYYQKSTTAEDGALDVLDRLMRAEARVAELEKEADGDMASAVDEVQAAVKRTTAPEIELASDPDDLTEINGIGPVYAKRLAEAGITTFETLAAQSSESLAEIAELPLANTADWIEQAKARIA